MPLPAQDLTWRLALAGSADSPLTLRELALDAQDLHLQASGTLDPTTLAGSARLALDAPALGPLSAPFGQPVDGRARLAADLGIGAHGERIEVDLTGSADSLAGAAARGGGTARRRTAPDRGGDDARTRSPP